MVCRSFWKISRKCPRTRLPSKPQRSKWAVDQTVSIYCFAIHFRTAITSRRIESPGVFSNLFIFNENVTHTSQSIALVIFTLFLIPGLGDVRWFHQTTYFRRVVDAVVVKINGIPAAIADFDTISLTCVRSSTENEFSKKNAGGERSCTSNCKAGCTAG